MNRCAVGHTTMQHKAYQTIAHLRYLAGLLRNLSLVVFLKKRLKQIKSRVGRSLQRRTAAAPVIQNVFRGHQVCRSLATWNANSYCCSMLLAWHMCECDYIGRGLNCAGPTEVSSNTPRYQGNSKLCERVLFKTPGYRHDRLRNLGASSNAPIPRTVSFHKAR